MNQVILKNELENYGVIPVVKINDYDEAELIAQSLIKSNHLIIEITYRSEFTPKAIEYFANKYPEIIVGAGTVINAEQAKEAISLGVKFLVSPGNSVKLMKFANKNNVLFIPGCITPSEIMKAVSYGYDIVKLFPASTYGGVDLIKNLSAVFNVKFMPTGGINYNNLNEYLENDKVLCCGGSWLLKSKDVRDNVETITVAQTLVKKIRGNK